MNYQMPEYPDACQERKIEIEREMIKPRQKCQNLMKPNEQIPSGPFIASNQYGMHFILSQDNKIIWRCDWLPMETLREITNALNEALFPNSLRARKK